MTISNILNRVIHCRARALVALLAYAGAGEVDWLVGLPLAFGGIAAISAGVKFASRLPERR
jgi:uncharacterized membrane protein YfcA